jgi:hypothetical protein
MMAGKSQYLENAMLNWMKGTTFLAAPTTVYAALFTTAPTDDSGASAVEVSGGSYARASITTSTGWSSISGAPAAAAQISNGSTITFATPTANWGTILAIGVYDASSSGNLLYWNTITSQTITSGVVASFAASTFVVTDD